MLRFKSFRERLTSSRLVKRTQASLVEWLQLLERKLTLSATYDPDELRMKLNAIVAREGLPLQSDGKPAGTCTKCGREAEWLSVTGAEPDPLCLACIPATRVEKIVRALERSLQSSGSKAN